MESSPFSEWPEWMTQIYRQLPTFQIELDLKPVSKITFAAVDFLCPPFGQQGAGWAWECTGKCSLSTSYLQFPKIP